MESEELKRLSERVAAVRETLDRAAQGRPYTLLAASKTQSAETINLLPACGIYDYGENRVQEWVEKHEKISESLRFHHIGRLQSNKIKYIINHVVLIHSVDRLDLAREISRLAVKNGRCVDVLLQVNPAGEEQKGGVSPQELPQLYESCLDLAGIRVRGLMCMAPNTLEERIVHETFAAARKCFDALAAQDERISVLSMGMSQDYGLAARAGATMVRVGSALFR